MFLALNILVGNYLISEISCGYVNSTTFGNHKAGRIGRFFGLFNIVSFRDDECNSTTPAVRGIYVLTVYRSDTDSDSGKVKAVNSRALVLALAKTQDIF